MKQDLWNPSWCTAVIALGLGAPVGCGARAVAPDAVAPDVTAPDATAPDATAPDAVAPIRRGPLPIGVLPEGFDVGAGCRFPSGRACPPRASCPADDECNGCNCEPRREGGYGLSCTLIGCAARQRTRAEVTAWDCQFDSGRWCRSICIADDGCNACRCHPDGTFSCTTSSCEAATPSACREDSDCPRRQECRALSPGCGLRPRCVPAAASGDFAWFCRCDGVTAIEFARPSRPYAAAGPCPGYRSNLDRACETDADCGGNMRCDRGSPARCVQLCNSTSALMCPADARCVTTRDHSSPSCLRVCESDADCADTPGLHCRSFTPVSGFPGRGCAP